MQIERKQTRQMRMNVLLSFIPDALIAYISMRLTDSGPVGFAATFVGLWLLYFAIWLKNSIWSWFLYLLWVKKLLTAAMLAGFRANDYPEPGEFEKSADDYLTRVSQDEALPVQLRLRAAADYASLHALNIQGFQRFLQLSSALDNALEQYKNQFPPKGAKRRAA